MTWEPFSLTFKEAVCNVGGDGISSAYSIIVTLTEESQKSTLAFVTSIEQNMIAHGIPVNRPRSQQEPFHSTLAVVDYYFPVDEALAAVNAKIPIYNSQPMIVDQFTMLFPPHEFYASNSTRRSLAVFSSSKKVQ